MTGITPTYELKDASRSYGQNSTLVLALEALDLTIKRGEFVAIFGPSGSGKTTLLQLLGALDRPSAGSIRFEGQPLERLGDSALAELRLRAIGFVFQQFNLIPTLNAAENVEAGLAPSARSRFSRFGPPYPVDSEVRASPRLYPVKGMRLDRSRVVA